MEARHGSYVVGGMRRGRGFKGVAHDDGFVSWDDGETG